MDGSLIGEFSFEDNQLAVLFRAALAPGEYASYQWRVSAKPLSFAPTLAYAITKQGVIVIKGGEPSSWRYYREIDPASISLSKNQKDVTFACRDNGLPKRVPLKDFATGPYGKHVVALLQNILTRSGSK
jgi:hypothetical protein